MTSYISHTTVDSLNAYELSEWWKPVLGYTDLPDDPNLPGHVECMLVDPATNHQLLFLEVPDAKSVKNRVHFDLRPREVSRDEEVARLLEYGATQVADHRGIHGPGSGWVVLADPEGNNSIVLPTTSPGWVVLADPEGNEFCVLRSQAEVDAAEGFEWVQSGTDGS